MSVPIKKIGMIVHTYRFIRLINHVGEKNAAGQVRLWMNRLWVNRLWMNRL